MFLFYLAAGAVVLFTLRIALFEYRRQWERKPWK